MLLFMEVLIYHEYYPINQKSPTIIMLHPAISALVKSHLAGPWVGIRP